MELSLMKAIRQYASERAGSALLVETQTNGAFSGSKARWLAENVDIIWVSSDGLPEAQDTYRRTVGGKPSSPIVEKNIRFLAQNGRGMVGIRTTITALNVRTQKEMLDYFFDCGVRTVWSDPLFPAVGQQTAEGAPDPLEYARELVAAEQHARDKGMFYGSILTCNFDEDTDRHCRACLPVPHLTTDGYVSACDMALFGSDPGPMAVFIYGRWNEERGVIEYDSEKIGLLQSRSINRIPGCGECEARYRCGGYCLGEVVNETGSLFGRKDRACEAIRFLWRHMPRPATLFRYLHP